MLFKKIDPTLSKITVIASNDEFPSGMLEGYASVFGNKDLGGDVVEKGAFTKTLRERLAKGAIKLFDSHRVFEGNAAVIGVVVDAKEDDYGLWFRAKFSGVPRAQEHRQKIAEGVLGALSFGYDIVKDQWDETTKVRYLKELKLYEVSIVPWGMNPKAGATVVKGFEPWEGEEEPQPPAEVPPADPVAPPVETPEPKAETSEEERKLLEAFKDLQMKAAINLAARELTITRR